MAGFVIPEREAGQQKGCYRDSMTHPECYRAGFCDDAWHHLCRGPEVRGDECVGLRAKKNESPFHLYHVQTYLQFLEGDLNVGGGCAMALMSKTESRHVRSRAWETDCSVANDDHTSNLTFATRCDTRKRQADSAYRLQSLGQTKALSYGRPQVIDFHATW